MATGPPERRPQIVILTFEVAMRTGLVVALVLLSTLVTFATADEPASPDPEARFQALLDQAKSHPDTADWQALRVAFTKTSAYRPYAVEMFDTGPVEQELKNGERSAALQALNRILEGHWVDPAAHEYAIGVCEAIDEPAEARLHKIFVTRILDTILGARNAQKDGQSYEEAWPVLTIREEYLVLDAFDLKDGVQKLVEEAGHFYDVHTFENPQTGRNLTIYFNVDLPRQWLRNHGPGLERK